MTQRDASARGKRVVVVGAGIIGSACAWRLAQRGFVVTVLERARLGVDAASTAAAGMLGAQIEAHPNEAMQRLCVASRDRYPEFVAALRTDAKQEVELRRTGAMRVALDRAELGVIDADVSLQRERGLEARMLDREQTARMEPRLGAVVGAGWFAGDGVVEPRSLLEATCAAGRARGVEFREGTGVASVDFDGDVACGVTTDGGQRIAADIVVVSAGSRSTHIASLDGMGVNHDAVAPVRGQMIELRLDQPWTGPIIEGASAYLSPRADGRMLVGSTVEHVGFERRVTAGAVARLLGGAIALAPELEHAEVQRCWCGFRASTSDALPVIDRVGNVVMATGHYRNGIVLAPVTADAVVALVVGDEPAVDVTMCSVRRLAEQTSPPRGQRAQGRGSIGRSAAGQGLDRKVVSSGHIS